MTHCSEREKNNVYFSFVIPKRKYDTHHLLNIYFYYFQNDEGGESIKVTL